VQIQEGGILVVLHTQLVKAVVVAAVQKAEEAGVHLVSVEVAEQHCNSHLAVLQIQEACFPVEVLPYHRPYLDLSLQHGWSFVCCFL